MPFLAYADVWSLNGTNIYNNNSGNVGIGTNAPATTLHIKNSYPSFRFERNTSLFSSYWDYVISYYGENSYGTLFLVPSISTADFEIRDSTGNTRFYIDTSSGNIGLGGSVAIPPKAQLIVGRDEFSANISGSSSGKAVFGSNFAVYEGGNNHNRFYTPGTHPSYGYSGMASAWGSLFFYTNSGATISDQIIDPPIRMFISQTGRIGIGTGNLEPQSLLSVNGTITAKEIKVTMNGWSDFVFDKEYKLPSLDHVESYIKENKHLPDVPSAQDIKKDGLAMANMMAKQMQKIEELTLYVIDLRKQNEKLAQISSELKLQNDQSEQNSLQEIAGLKAKIEALEKRINN